MSGAGPPSAPPRWDALDALRGLAIAAMILVNNPGRWGAKYQYAPLRHADWHGCTPTDLVFPTFLFVVGTAIVPAFAGKLAAGVPRGPLVLRILRRVVVLCLLGMLLSAFPLVTLTGPELFLPLLQTRFPGVLQRIGVCYGIAALLYLYTPPRVWLLVLLGCLVLYWPLITLVPVPGQGPPDISAPATTLQGYVDRAVFGQHIWQARSGGVYDPEGLLSTIPAVATILFGVFAGRVLAQNRPPSATARTLLVAGALLAGCGLLWSLWLPLNKPLWTSSYAVFTAGLATAALGVFVAALSKRSGRRWLLPLQVYGRNALLVFVGSGLLGRTIGSLITVPGPGGRSVSLKDWCFDHALLSWAEPAVASLLFALLWVLGWYLVLAWLWRRGIVWKV